MTLKSNMLRFIAIIMFALVAGKASAQDSTTAGEDLKNATRKTGKAIKKGADKVGKKTAEIASKAKSEVVDKTYEGKVGPDGEKIYIDSHARYYYVDSKGHKKYVTEAQLKDK